MEKNPIYINLQDKKVLDWSFFRKSQKLDFLVPVFYFPQNIENFIARGGVQFKRAGVLDIADF